MFITLNTFNDLLTYLTTCAELLAKIEDDDDNDPEDCLEFWQTDTRSYSNLFKLMKKVHSVPATSATVQSVFSHGGIIGHSELAWVIKRSLTSFS